MIRRILAAVLLVILAATPLRAEGTGALRPAAWLAAQPPGSITVLDVRPAAAFASGHIPGALNLPLASGAWVETRYSVPFMLAPPEKLASALGRLGIAADDGVMVVSGSGNLRDLAEGARAFWSLRALGHDRLFLLDGGIARWDGALTGETAQHPATLYRPAPDPTVIAGFADVEDALDERIPPIDARSRREFYGHEKSPLVALSGTIIDAENMPAGKVLDPASGLFRPPAALRAQLDDTGAVTIQRRIVVFSDLGLRAALVWFAIHEVLGFDYARLYDGSLAGWAHGHGDFYDSTDGMGGVIGG